MKLYLDTSHANKSVIRLGNTVYEKSGEYGMAQHVLEMIEGALESQNKKLKDITEIKVNTGPGSFTGLRVGVTVAQTLGWALGIRVNGKNMTHDTIAIKYN